MLDSIWKDLQSVSSREKAASSSRFFKTGIGQYGEGDIFIGVTVPEQRKVAQKYYKDVDLDEIQDLLNSKIHEYRLTALIILTLKFKKADSTEQKEIVDFYLKNTENINNWDLVDGSAPYILGKYLLDKPREILYSLAKSGTLWEERISVLATYTFIKNNDFEDILKLAKLFLSHRHDLMHKAVGWMLREVGKQNILVLEQFLKENYKTMPRTMLRYAIEKFEPEIRNKILTGEY